MKRLWPKAISRASKILFLIIFLAGLLLAVTWFLTQSQWSDQWRYRSRINLMMKNNVLKIDFMIDPTDKPVMEAFSQRMGVNTQWTEGIALTIDHQSAAALANWLPIQAVMQISEDSLTFSPLGWGWSTAGLQSAIPTDQLNWATGSAYLKSAAVGGQTHLTGEDLGAVLSYATASGQLTVANDLLNSLGPIAATIRRIDLGFGPGQLTGRVELK